MSANPIPSALPIVSSCRAFALQCKPYGVARVLNDSADTIEELYEALEELLGSAFDGPAYDRAVAALAKARGEQVRP